MKRIRAGICFMVLWFYAIAVGAFMSVAFTAIMCLWAYTAWAVAALSFPDLSDIFKLARILMGVTLAPSILVVIIVNRKFLW